MLEALLGDERREKEQVFIIFYCRWYTSPAKNLVMPLSQGRQLAEIIATAKVCVQSAGPHDREITRLGKE